MQLFGLSAAHANDRAEPHEFVAISGGLLLIYGIGSMIGPVLAPLVMAEFGPSSMFAFTAGTHAFLALYGIYRLTQKGSAKRRRSYVAIPRPRSFMVTLRQDPRFRRLKVKVKKPTVGRKST